MPIPREGPSPGGSGSGEVVLKVRPGVAVPNRGVGADGREVVTSQAEGFLT
jgi:hypothetical protein